MKLFLIPLEPYKIWEEIQTSRFTTLTTDVQINYGNIKTQIVDLRKDSVFLTSCGPDSKNASKTAVRATMVRTAYFLLDIGSPRRIRPTTTDKSAIRKPKNGKKTVNEPQTGWDSK